MLIIGPLALLSFWPNSKQQGKIAPNSFSCQNQKSFKTGPTNSSIFFTMNIVLNVIIQHGCKCLTWMQNVLLYAYRGGNYFFEITVSSFVYLQCNWRSEMYYSVTHCTVTTSCMEKRGVVDKSSHISLRCYRLLTVSVSCYRTRCGFFYHYS